MSDVRSNPESQTAVRAWQTPRLEKLDLDQTRSGGTPADEDLVTDTAPILS